MAYIGNVPAEKYIALTQQTFSSPTGTSFTLSQAVTNSVDIDLYIDNVKQDPASYSVSGTALTTSTIASPSTMYCIYNGKAMQTVNPPDGSVGTAKVTDDAITLAKLAPGTDGNIISYDASGNPVAIATGNDGQVLTSAGAGAPPVFEALPAAGITLGTAVASTSGATIDFTGIPSGTKRILVNVDQISTSGGSIPMLQIGDSGGFETSAYAGCIAWTQGSNIVVSRNFTTGFGVFANWGSSTIGSGTNVLSLLDPATNTWVSSSSHGRNGNVGNWHGGGGKSLSGVLTQVRFTTVGGSETFDAGKINISYE